MVRFTVDNRNRLIFYGNPVGYVKADTAVVDKQRRITNISECEILPDGSRRLHKLYEYHITDNHLEDNRFIIEGEHRKCEEISESLRRRFIENGMPLGELAQFVQGKEEDE